MELKGELKVDFKLPFIEGVGLDMIATAEATQDKEGSALTDAISVKLNAY